MKTCKEGTSSGQLEGLPVTPDLPGFVARHHCPFVLRLYVLHLSLLSINGFAHASIVDLSRLRRAFATII